ncbi:unnamed protein product [Amoebophrya sp. A25]|nr:unnamed protein product [Amoebophrya sp. A25]|eukprot:GSA25T00009879001.1
MNKRTTREPGVPLDHFLGNANNSMSSPRSVKPDFGADGGAQSQSFLFRNLDVEDRGAARRITDARKPAATAEMQKNIGQMLENQEKLEQLEKDTKEMADEARDYKGLASRLEQAKYKEKLIREGKLPAKGDGDGGTKREDGSCVVS